MFKERDLNKDGVITEDEFAKTMKIRDSAVLPKTPAEYIKAFDKNKDEKISKDEFKQPEKRFLLIDANKDNFITLNELENYYKKADARFNKFDKNQDGKVTKKEFAGGIESFKILDANADGVIEKIEFNRNFPRLPYEKKVMLMSDKNNDGKISLDEFNGNPKLFKSIDANKDEFLTSGELAAFAKETKGKKGKKPKNEKNDMKPINQPETDENKIPVE